MSVLQNIKTTYKYNGVRGVIRKIKYKLTSGYGHFLRVEEKPTWHEMVELCKAFEYCPKLSAIIPVYQPDVWQLAQCVDSILAQPYQMVEVVLSLDGKVEESVEQYLQQITMKDARMIIVRSEQNEGIASASNKALAAASGEYVMLVDQDDMLAPHAVIEIITVLQEKQYDFIYTDEDMINERNKRFSPQFKPDWSPHTLLSRMYVNHLSVYRKVHVDAVGGFRSEYDGSQDYDLLLRASRNFETVKHIPKILYHWRTSKDSIATDIANKSYIFERAKAALSDYFKSDNYEVQVQAHGDLLIYDLEIEPRDKPLISIVISFKDEVEQTVKLLDSIQQYAGYENKEIILINNQSTEKTMELIENYIQNSTLHIACYDGSTSPNYAQISDEALQHAQGAYILFLSNKIEWSEENTLKKMLGVAQFHQVGVVGCTLLYPNDIIYQTGIIVNVDGIHHIGSGQGKTEHGYYGRNVSLFNTSAVASACFLVKKDNFVAIGGFDETMTREAQVIDVCLRFVQEGHYNVNVGNVRMYYHKNEALLAKSSLTPENIHQITKNTQYEYKDPCYNSNLSLRKDELFQLKGK